MYNTDFFINFKLLFSPFDSVDDVEKLQQMQKIHNEIEKFDEKILQKRMNIIYLGNLKTKWQKSIENIEERNSIKKMEAEKRLKLYNAVTNNLKMQEELIMTLTTADLNLKKYYTLKHKIEKENIEKSISDVEKFAIELDKATGNDHTEEIEALKLEIDAKQKEYDEVSSRIEKENKVLEEKLEVLDNTIKDRIVSILLKEQEMNRIDSEMVDIDNEIKTLIEQIKANQGNLMNLEADFENEQSEIENKNVEYLQIPIRSLRATPTLDDIPEIHTNCYESNSSNKSNNLVDVIQINEERNDKIEQKNIYIKGNKQNELISAMNQSNTQISITDSNQKSSNIFESTEVTNKTPKIIIHKNIRIKSPIYNIVSDEKCNSENEIPQITPYQKDHKISQKSISNFSQSNDSVYEISDKSLKRKSIQSSSSSGVNLPKKKIKTSENKLSSDKYNKRELSSDDLNGTKSQLNKKIKDNNKQSSKKHLKFDLKPSSSSTDNNDSFMSDNHDNDINIDEFKIFCTNIEQNKIMDRNNDKIVGGGESLDFHHHMNLNGDDEPGEASDFNMDLRSPAKFGDNKTGTELFGCDDGGGDFFTL